MSMEKYSWSQYGLIYGQEIMSVSVLIYIQRVYFSLYFSPTPPISVWNIIWPYFLKVWDNIKLQTKWIKIQMKQLT